MKSEIKNRQSQIAFTLVELLVVVTIIVVLLALLAPALDKAIHSAEMAACGARLHGLGTGVATYALDFKRQYPHRKTTMSFGAYNDALSYGSGTGANTLFNDIDDRPTYKGYLILNGHMLCPFNERVDLGGSDFDTLVFANYSLFFSVKYATNQAKPLTRMGDRLAYKNAQVDYTFDALAADTSTIFINSSFGDLVISSHPDRPDGAGVLFSRAIQDEGDAGLGVSINDKSTYSRWQTDSSTGVYKLVSQDFNVLAQDQSVTRYNQVEWDDPDWAPVPRAANEFGYLGDQQGIGTYLPLR